MRLLRVGQHIYLWNGASERLYQMIVATMAGLNSSTTTRSTADGMTLAESSAVKAPARGASGSQLII
jgi:hypothetical protein